jgi:hypothetical protein
MSVPSLNQLEHLIVRVSGRRRAEIVSPSLKLLEPGDLTRYPHTVGTIVRYADYEAVKDLVERGVITRKELDLMSDSSMLAAAHMAAAGGNVGAVAPLLTGEDLLVRRGTGHKFTALEVAQDYNKLDTIPPALLRKAAAIQTARNLGESTLGDNVRLQRHNERLSRLFWAIKTKASPEEAIEVCKVEGLTSDDLVARDPTSYAATSLLAFILSGKKADTLGKFIKPLIKREHLTSGDPTPLHLAVFHGTAALVWHLVTPELLLTNMYAGGGDVLSVLDLVLAAIKTGPGGTTMKGRYGTDDVVVDPKLIRQATALKLAQEESAASLVAGLLG